MWDNVAKMCPQFPVETVFHETLFSVSVSLFSAPRDNRAALKIWDCVLRYAVIDLAFIMPLQLLI